MSHPLPTVHIAHEVRHQALRLADRQPRHPRTVPPEEELVGAIRAPARAGPVGPGKATAMSCTITNPGHATNLTGVKIAHDACAEAAAARQGELLGR